MPEDKSLKESLPLSFSLFCSQGNIPLETHRKKVAIPIEIKIVRAVLGVIIGCEHRKAGEVFFGLHFDLLPFVFSRDPQGISFKVEAFDSWKFFLGCSIPQNQLDVPGQEEGQLTADLVSFPGKSIIGRIFDDIVFLDKKERILAGHNPLVHSGQAKSDLIPKTLGDPTRQR